MPSNQKNLLGAYLSLAGAMLIVGSSAVVGKVLVAEMPVALSQELRFVLALPLLLALLWRREGGLPRLRPRTWAVAGLQALGGVVIFNACLLCGLKLTSAAHAGILTSVTPASMAVAAWLLFGERLRGRAGLGVFLAVAGVLALTVGDAALHGFAGALSGRMLLGDLLVLGAVAGETLFLLLRKAVREPVSPLAFSTVMNIYGVLLFLPLAASEALRFDFASVSTRGWLAVGWSSAALSVAAYLLWFRGVVRVSGGVAGVFTGLMPLTAVSLSFLLLGESITWAQLAGCGLVLAAIGCICRR
ncbi:MAG: DMT family transporter [Desulfovibrio sp.]